MRLCENLKIVQLQVKIKNQDRAILLWKENLNNNCCSNICSARTFFKIVLCKVALCTPPWNLPNYFMELSRLLLTCLNFLLIQLAGAPNTMCTECTCTPNNQERRQKIIRFHEILPICVFSKKYFSKIQILQKIVT